jgi:hypothetical protein
MEQKRGIGLASVAIGVLSLVRLTREIVLYQSAYFDLRITMLFTFDAMVGTAWIASGLCLLCRQASGLQWTAIAAGAAAARTIMSIVPPLSVSNWRFGASDEEVLLPAMVSRFLHYGLECAYWPVVLYLLFFSSRCRWRRPDREAQAGFSFAATGVVVALLQLAFVLSLP